MSVRRCARSSNVVIAVALIVAALALSACGSSGDAASARSSSALAPGALHKRTPVTLILDFIPNAVHAGIYRAIAAGYYARENIDLHVIQPTSTSETLKLIDAGRAQFGLADGIDVAEEIANGHDAKAVMAITQLPLGAPIALASEHLTSPTQLQGKTVGITGVPSDTAVLDTRRPRCRRRSREDSRRQRRFQWRQGSCRRPNRRVSRLLARRRGSAGGERTPGYVVQARSLRRAGVSGPGRVHQPLPDALQPRTRARVRGGNRPRLRRHPEEPPAEPARSAAAQSRSPAAARKGLARRVPPTVRRPPAGRVRDAAPEQAGGVLGLAGRPSADRASRSRRRVSAPTRSCPPLGNQPWRATAASAEPVDAIARADLAGRPECLRGARPQRHIEPRRGVPHS